jgi:hypothetical protein
MKEVYMTDKKYLIARKAELEKEIEEIEYKLEVMINMEKPYVANVSAYSGHYSMQFKTVEKAIEKLNEYASKQYFKNGLNYGVYLYKWNEDGSKTLIDYKSVGRKDFYPNEFK